MKGGKKKQNGISQKGIQVRISTRGKTSIIGGSEMRG